MEISNEEYKKLVVDQARIPELEKKVKQYRTSNVILYILSAFELLFIAWLVWQYVLVVI